MKTKWTLALLAVATAVSVYVGNVLATPPTTPGFSGATLARATFGELDIKANMIPNVWKADLKTKGNSDLYVQQNTWDPENAVVVVCAHREYRARLRFTAASVASDDSGRCDRGASGEQQRTSREISWHGGRV